MLADLDVGRMYRVLARLDDGRVGTQLIAKYRGKVKFRGATHLWFEGETFEHLIRTDYIEEIEKVKTVW